jgi:hypothetical protein
LGWARNGGSYIRCRESLSRLKANEVQVINNRAFGRGRAISLISNYETINDGNGQANEYRVWIDKDIILLFAGNTFTGHAWLTYRQLSPVARRMSDYIESHKQPFPLALKKFQLMCGSKDTQLKSFRETTRRAADELMTKGIAKTIVLDPKTDLIHFQR